MNEAYDEGANAALRQGKYAGATIPPENPFDEGTREHDEWDDGFGDATEALIVWQRAD